MATFEIGQLIGIERIEAVRAQLAPYVRPTPLLAMHDGLWLKAENLHPCGAFKLRGALNTLMQAPAEMLARGVVAPSSGNHAQAIAYAARIFGVKALAVMPQTSPLAKREGVRRWGAEVHLIDTLQEGPVSPWAEIYARENGLFLAHPFDSPHIVAATGAIGLELLETLDTLDEVFVPVSGGGLISGIAAAVKARKPRVRVIGVEPALANDAQQSFRSGARQSLTTAQTARTMADGLRVEQVGQFTWPHIQALVDDIVTVTEDEIADMMLAIAREAYVLAEPSGAVAPAAARRDGRQKHRTAAVISGGNCDPALLARLHAERQS